MRAERTGVMIWWRGRGSQVSVQRADANLGHHRDGRGKRAAAKDAAAAQTRASVPTWVVAINDGF